MSHITAYPSVAKADQGRRALRWVLYLLVLVLCLYGLVWVLVSGYERAMLAKDADHLFTQVLASGNLQAIHRHADPRFQAVCPLETFEAWAAENAACFERDKIQALEIVWLSDHGDLLVALRARVDSREVRYFSRPKERGGWRLLGIEPGLDAAVPRNLLPVK